MRNLLLYGVGAAAAVSALAQSPGTGAIAGRITDASGAALTGASRGGHQKTLPPRFQDR